MDAHESIYLLLFSWIPLASLSISGSDTSNLHAPSSALRFAVLGREHRQAKEQRASEVSLTVSLLAAMQVPCDYFAHKTWAILSLLYPGIKVKGL